MRHYHAIVFAASLGSTTLTLSNASTTTMVATWTPALGEGLTDYQISYQPKRSPGEKPSDAVRFVL